ncbi:MAG: ATP-binding protein [Flavobacteriaceae bacterium]|nr:ATP-binding protein [Flavobacteriaceae bacterium]
MSESQLNYTISNRLIAPEFNYLKRLLQYRLERYLRLEGGISKPALPTLDAWSLEVPPKIKSARLSEDEITVLLLAICPHVKSNLIDTVVHNTLESTGDFPMIGGVRGKNFRGFLPTGETALFLVAGENHEKRKEVLSFFNADHFFAKHHILWLDDSPNNEPAMSAKLICSEDYVDLFISGQIKKPSFSMKFPAQIIETALNWDDLVLNKEAQTQIEELQVWINHRHILMNDWGMHKKLKPGYRVLFHGPPGTGKTLTASLLGKYTNKEVYRIDLSMVVSKFIGETEKNLANLLARAEKTENILFFDECDALFAKRTNVRDAHDKYANQEVSYLLQRIEAYKGLVILATNLKSNIDEAFLRRFQSIIHFPLPKPAERLQLWQKAFPAAVKLQRDVDLAKNAQNYELSGAEIMNVVQYACLSALAVNEEIISQEYIINGIQREFQKTGRIMR